MIVNKVKSHSDARKVWPIVRLAELLKRSNQKLDPQANVEYREITVRLWGKGVVERGRIKGAEPSGFRFVARAAQFIASRIDARNGAWDLFPKLWKVPLESELHRSRGKGDVASPEYRKSMVAQ